MKRFFRRFTLLLSGTSPITSINKIKNGIFSRSPDELKPTLSALIMDKRLEAAEQLYESLMQAITMDMASLSSPSITNVNHPPFNSNDRVRNINSINDNTIKNNDWIRYTAYQFIEAYLECNRRVEAEKWLFKPTINQDPFAYALFIKFYLGNNDFIAISHLLERIKCLPISISAVLEHLTRIERDNFTRYFVNGEMATTINNDNQSSKVSISYLINPYNSTGRSLNSNSITATATAIVTPSSSLPIKSIESKNQGISFIKQSLRQLTEKKEDCHGTTSNQTNGKFDSWHLQELLEQDCMSSSIAQYQKYQSSMAGRTGLGGSATTTTSSITEQLGKWMRQLADLIDDFILQGSEGNIQPSFPFAPLTFGSKKKGEKKSHLICTNNSSLYAAMLRTLSSEKIALIVLQEINKLKNVVPELQGTPVVKLASSIGDAIDREIFAMQVSRKEFLRDLYIPKEELSRLLHDRNSFDRLRLKAIQKYEMDLQDKRDNWIPRWSSNIKVEIGSILIDMAIKNLELDSLDSLQESLSSSSSSSPSFFEKNKKEKKEKRERIEEKSVKTKKSIGEGEGEPAYFHQYARHEGNKSYGIVKINPKLIDHLVRDKSALFVEPTLMPMVIPPRPWISYNSGGYLLHRNYFVRLKDDDYHLAEIHKANSLDSLGLILEGLDHLGQTAWKINDFTLEIAVKMWNGGVNVATMKTPPIARSFSYMKKEDFPSKEEYLKYVREAIDHRMEMTNSHSLMCDVNYKLEIANQFSGIPFYLPHSVDFRGRAYPIPPHLSHIGSDLSRGLMLFNEGRPLGERGIRWLKIHISNKYGVDKCSFDERVSFVDRNMNAIVDSVEKPLEGLDNANNANKWWRQAEEPWQCLAACHELVNALRSPLPEAYISHLPIHQDGSCNGLQHYAALGRDVEGGQSVNLVPNAKPQDIYAEVAKKVSEHLEKEAMMTTSRNSNGKEGSTGIETSQLANMLRGKITRKIIKQPVMTSVYGVSPFGARLQILERLKEYKIVDKEYMNKCASYLSKLTFSSLESMFSSANAIQEWFHNSAREIACSLPIEAARRFGCIIEEFPSFSPSSSSSSPETMKKDQESKKRKSTRMNRVATVNDPSSSLSSNATALSNDNHSIDFGENYPQTEISWTTPLGFKVVQPYKKSNVIKLQTVLQVISLRQTNKDDPIDRSKQSTAFPPNFIHSLDASHMFMTANECHKNKIVFASVHDSFWTHAGTIDKMNQILREQFVALHQKPILENLRSEFTSNYGAFKVPVDIKSLGNNKNSKWRNIRIDKLPEMGKLELEQVLKSEYFFN